ncbi:carbon-nitrogen hydrolase family protein [Tenacibaculum sp. nBUS_03]|uniref:carbon-nitrogen hydrolase family protein n=1 Tax=Tenacibaculum sp. nBUS_03 TaxID=3395320 RepID=UPI003EB83AAF
MKIAATQIDVTVGEIEKNITTHIKAIKEAVKEKVDLIAFPEMSITGYCREEGKGLAFIKKDKRLNSLRKLSEENNIIVVVGAPILIDDMLYIGSFILKPDGEEEIYTKQYLHSGEEIYYKSSFLYNPKVTIAKEQLSFAICADIDNEKHPEQAKIDKSTLYVPSIFFSKEGIVKGHSSLKRYSEKYMLPILMSNFCGEHWGMHAGGKSAFWDEKGKELIALDSEKEGLIIIEKQDEKWKGKSIVL